MIRRAKTPVGTDWWFGIDFRRWHLSVVIFTATPKQSQELDRLMHEGFAE